MGKLLSLETGRLDRLARRVNAAHSKVGDAASKVVTHAMECGLALIEARAILDHGEWARWIEANCSFSYRMACHYIRIACALPYLPAENLKRVSQLSLRECIKALCGNNTAAIMGSSSSDDWFSPRKVVSLAAKVMGAIDLDPAWHRGSVVKAKRKYSIAQDGLSKPWHGKVFLNPPHSRLSDWVNKGKSEYESGHVTQGILLLPARVDSAWWRTLDDFPRCFIHGRLQFHNSVHSAPFPSSVIYLGRNITKFAATFNSVGTVFVRYPG